jgi:hypothetical protein
VNLRVLSGKWNCAGHGRSVVDDFTEPLSEQREVGE